MTCSALTHSCTFYFYSFWFQFLIYPLQNKIKRKKIQNMIKLTKLLNIKNLKYVYFQSYQFSYHLCQLRVQSQTFAQIQRSWCSQWSPFFRFETIPNGLSPTDVDATQDIPSLDESTSKTCLPHFKKLLHMLNNSSSSNVPPVSYIVSDGITSFTLDAAEELGVPEVIFWTSSARGFLGYCYYRQLMEKGYIPLKSN